MKNRKMSNMKSGILMISVLVFALVATAAGLQVKQDKWVVPEAAKKMKNPTDPTDKDGQYVGKSLYLKHCRSCHGKIGKGDGPKSAELKTPCGDLTSADVKGQTDGELFYKISEGKGDMPSFKKRIVSDEDRWNVVNYVRTLNAKK